MGPTVDTDVVEAFGFVVLVLGVDFKAHFPDAGVLPGVVAGAWSWDFSAGINIRISSLILRPTLNSDQLTLFWRLKHKIDALSTASTLAIDHFPVLYDLMAGSVEQVRILIVFTLRRVLLKEFILKLTHGQLWRAFLHHLLVYLLLIN